jgi:hypothetical protein
MHANRGYDLIIAIQYYHGFIAYLTLLIAHTIQHQMVGLLTCIGCVSQLMYGPAGDAL